MTKRVVICYDFDKTLTPLDMQSQGFVQSLGMSVDEFWKEVDEYSVRNKVELNLTYMFKMLEKCKQKDIALTRDYLRSFGKDIKFYDGLDTWFDRVNSFGKEHGVEVYHYIVSSGIKEIVEGTPIADKFDKIYASSFHYGEDGKAVWPAFVVNYTNKTQFLFRISKGVFDELDDGVNSAVEDGKYFAFFKDFVYIGDSDTDIPCMALISKYEGRSVGVYDKTAHNTRKVERLEREHRIQVAAEADYSAGGALEKAVEEFIATR